MTLDLCCLDGWSILRGLGKRLYPSTNLSDQVTYCFTCLLLCWTGQGRVDTPTPDHWGIRGYQNTNCYCTRFVVHLLVSKPHITCSHIWIKVPMLFTWASPPAMSSLYILGGCEFYSYIASSLLYLNCKLHSTCKMYHLVPEIFYHSYAEISLFSPLYSPPSLSLSQLLCVFCHLESP